MEWKCPVGGGGGGGAAGGGSRSSSSAHNNNNNNTEKVGVAVTLLDLHSVSARYAVRISTGTPATLTEVSRGSSVPQGKFGCSISVTP